MTKRHRQPHDPTGRLALPRGKQKEEGVGLAPKNVAPRPITRSKTFGRIYGQLRQRPPQTKWAGMNGIHDSGDDDETAIGMEPLDLKRQQKKTLEEIQKLVCTTSTIQARTS